jgi:hypothetical protein
MGRKRCKLSPKEYAEKVCNKEQFVCPKCNRVAKSAKKLCKAKKIEIDKDKIFYR